MNILKKLTIKDLKLNKKRTLGTILGILLSSALITVVVGMLFTMQNTLFKGTVNETGYYHIQLSDISKEEVNKIKNNQDYSHFEEINDLGSTIIKDKHDNDITLKVYSMNKNSFDYLNFNLEGDFPKNENEIIIGSTVAKANDLKIGDTIKLDIGKLNIKEELSLENPKTYNFKITGTIQTYERLTITTNIDSENKDLYLTLKNPKNYRKDFKELLGVDPYNKEESENSKYDYAINSDLLHWEVFSFNDDVLKLLVRAVGIVLFIIIITSVFSIRNSFSISMTEKIKTYGMLSSVGATKKQIKKMVLFEGLYLGVIGIITGIVLGTVITFLLTQIINALASHANMLQNGWKFYYKFSTIPMIMAIVLGLIIIYLSSISSARKASKVSPIQNLRNSDNLKNKKIKLKTPKYIKGIFKIGGVLSYKNLKRSKRKYRVTIISLTVSIFVFIIASSFIEYGMKTIKEEYMDVDYNLVVRSNYGSEKFQEKARSIAELENGAIIYSVDYSKEGTYILKDESHIKYKNAISTICTEYNETGTKCIGDNIKGVYTHFHILDDESFKEYAKRINANYDQIKDKLIIINNTQDSMSQKKKFVDITSYKKGDEIKLNSIEKNNEKVFTVGAITSERYFGLEHTYSNQLTLIVNREYLDLETVVDSIIYNSKNPDKLQEKITQVDKDLNIYNLSEELKQIKTTILIFGIFIYGFIIVVTLIGITSVFNTITSNVELRQKDFAMLKSIGMTKKEFNRMITLESLFYSFKSLFIGIVLGIIGSYFVYKLMSGVADFGYIPPLKSIIIATIFIILIVFIIMKYSISKINKQNIIETIRRDNI